MRTHGANLFSLGYILDFWVLLHFKIAYDILFLL